MAAGEPGEANIYADAKAVYDWAKRDLKLRTGQHPQYQHRETFFIIDP